MLRAQMKCLDATDPVRHGSDVEEEEGDGLDAEMRLPAPRGVFCAYCSRAVGQTVFLICIECPEDAGFYCVDCFSVSACVMPHAPAHAYRVCEYVTTPLYSTGWSAREEELLLDALLEYGLGSWDAVADHVGTKTESECQTHYDQVYLNSSNFPLPQDEILPEVESDEVAGLELSMGGPEGSGVKDTAWESSRTAPHLVKKHSGNRRPRKNGGAHPHHVVSGYYPKRGDFDVEWDDDAEAVLADLSIGPDDSEEEVNLKVRLMEICGERLAERERVKGFVNERGLLDFEALRFKERKLTKAERELMASTQAFSRLHSKESQGELELALLYEHRLINRMYELAHYRSQGLRTFKEADLYELDRNRRKAEVQLRAAKEPAYNKTVVKSNHRGSRYLNRERQLGPGRGGSTPGALSSPAASPSLTRRATPEAPPPSESQLQDHDRRKDGADGLTNGNVKTTRSKDLPPPLDVSQMFGVERLFPREREACSALRLSPEQFVALRAAAIKESCRLGYGDGVTSSHHVTVQIDATAPADGTRQAAINERMMEEGIRSTGVIARRSEHMDVDPFQT